MLSRHQGCPGLSDKQKRIQMTNTIFQLQFCLVYDKLSTVVTVIWIGFNLFGRDHTGLTMSQLGRQQKEQEGFLIEEYPWDPHCHCKRKCSPYISVSAGVVIQHFGD